MKITPKKSKELKYLLAHKENLFDVSNFHTGPINVMFPHAISENIASLKKVFEDLELDADIYFAHKPTKSQAIIKQVEASGVCIDVASLNELKSALSSGFTGDRIEATGPKSQEFLRLALKHNVLMSLDSASELESIIQLKKSMSIDKVSVLIRLSSLTTSDRVMQNRPSRFGVSEGSLISIYEMCKANNIVLKGFHFHKDGYDMESKAGFVEHVLAHVKDAYSQGFSPDIINIGGGWRTCTIEDPKEWSTFVDVISEQVLNQNITDYWGREPYGLSINSRGKIDGRLAAVQKIYFSDYKKDLLELFGNDALKGRPLADVVTESMQSIIIEPGYVLLQNAGCTILKILDVKRVGDRTIVVTNSNVYNTSVAKLFEYVTDPILVSQEANSDACECFIAGNLCVEDDMIIKRKIYFDATPKKGDLIVLSNTAPYYMDFESAQPIQQPGPKRFAAVLHESKITFFADEVYDPYKEDLQ